MKRGEIYYIDKFSRATGSEQQSGRPAVIVSNDKCNENSEVLEVVFLTTRPKTDLPTHIYIRSSVKPSIALCEQISSVSTSRFGEYVGKCSDDEMQMIDAALEISPGLNVRVCKTEKTAPEHRQTAGSSDKGAAEELRSELLKAQTERDTLGRLYAEMLERMVAVK